MCLNIVWLYRWKVKKKKAVANVSRKINQNRRKPRNLCVDKGKELYNKHVRELVTIYSIEDEEKSNEVQRWNKTMKSFPAYHTSVILRVLDDLVEQYNNSRHSSIKMTPNEASLNKLKRKCLISCTL